MKKLVLLAALLTVSASAQSGPAKPWSLWGQVWASAFSQWSVQSLTPIPSAGTYTLKLSTAAPPILPGGQQFQPFATNAPLVIDSGANQETATPSAVSCSFGQGFCTITITLAKAHNYLYNVQSGTAGLQEAMNFIASQGGAVVVDASWTGQTSMITGASGSTKVEIIDQRLGQTTWYGWTGSVYQSAFSINNPPPGLSGVTLTGTTLAGTTTNTGTVMGGAVSPVSLQGLTFAAQFAGASTGAKLIAADTDSSCSVNCILIVSAAMAAGLPATGSLTHVYIDLRNGINISNGGFSLGSVGAYPALGAFAGNGFQSSEVLNSDGGYIQWVDNTQPVFVQGGGGPCGGTGQVTCGTFGTNPFKRLAQSVFTLPDLAQQTTTNTAGWLLGAKGGALISGDLIESSDEWGVATDSGVGGASGNLTLKTNTKFVSFVNGANSGALGLLSGSLTANRTWGLPDVSGHVGMVEGTPPTFDCLFADSVVGGMVDSGFGCNGSVAFPDTSHGIHWANNGFTGVLSMGGVGLSGNRAWNLPDAGGTVALTSQLPLSATSGTETIGAVAANACSATITVAVSGVTTAMVPSVAPVSDIGTGLSIGTPWPTAGNVNWRVCNVTTGPLTPSAVAWNIRVIQ